MIAQRPTSHTAVAVKKWTIIGHAHISTIILLHHRSGKAPRPTGNIGQLALNVTVNSPKRVYVFI